MSSIASIAANMGVPIRATDVIVDAIHTMRTHLGMGIGYLSEFVGENWCFAPWMRRGWNTWQNSAMPGRDLRPIAITSSLVICRR